MSFNSNQGQNANENLNQFLNYDDPKDQYYLNIDDSQLQMISTQVNEYQEMTQKTSNHDSNEQLDFKTETNKQLDKNKHNIRKNIIQSFFQYFSDQKNQNFVKDFVICQGQQLSRALKIAKKFFKSYQYNNNSLKKLISHKKYGKALEFYLTFEVQSWLQQSKVTDKEAHLNYIDFLKECCSNSLSCSSIISHKRSKKFKFCDQIFLQLPI